MDRGRTTVGFRAEPEEFPYGTYAEAQDPDGNVFGLLEEAPAR